MLPRDAGAGDAGNAMRGVSTRAVQGEVLPQKLRQSEPASFHEGGPLATWTCRRRRLKVLEDEIGWLRWLLADAMLDNAVLKEFASKNC